MDTFFKSNYANSDWEKKRLELLISLFIGSINNIERVGAGVPNSTLDKVKKKIQLFDGEQTRFIYLKPTKKRIRIQGLSGTGKTELLLHKLKDIYLVSQDSKIFFTCFNKVLANKLRTRIPEFFDFMKVEKQIEWNTRLWCASSWGSRNNPNSGAYRYICEFYGIRFHTFHSVPYNKDLTPFGEACRLAIIAIQESNPKGVSQFPFTHMIIDESQDFDENFFSLCELVTEKNVYIAGDIFQDIFRESFSSTIDPDFLLGKCYRTDPKTLMFAHGLGMGLFEASKFRWLDEKEWRDCGYSVTVQGSKLELRREPSRRFEDLDKDFESIKVIEVDSLAKGVIFAMKKIKEENTTAGPNDIGIILLDDRNYIYNLADTLEFLIDNEFEWKVTKAYESKTEEKDKVFISNRNNVKGLEFPFVICVTEGIARTKSYRNSIYTMLTRSFIQSYLLITKGSKLGLTDGMKEGLTEIIKNQRMLVTEPTEEEKLAIRTKIEYEVKSTSLYDMLESIFEELQIPDEQHSKLTSTVNGLGHVEWEFEKLKDFVRYTYNNVLDQ
jgi:superfamily I DNA and RNA helicase